MFAIPRSLRCVIGAALLLALSPGGAGAADRVTTCRKALGKAGTALVRAILSAEQGCLERVLGGKLPPGTGCTDAGASTAGISDPATLAKVQKAIAKARTTAAKPCADLSVATAAPSGLGMSARCPSADTECAAIDVTDMTSLLDCLQCAHVGTAQGLVAVPYATTSSLAVPPASHAETRP